MKKVATKKKVAVKQGHIKKIPKKGLERAFEKHGLVLGTTD